MSTNEWTWGSGKIWISQAASEWIKKTYPGLLEEHGYWGYPDDNDQDQRCVCSCGERLEAEDDAARVLFEHVGQVVAERIRIEKQEEAEELRRIKLLREAATKAERERVKEREKDKVKAALDEAKASAALARARDRYKR